MRIGKNSRGYKVAAGSKAVTTSLNDGTYRPKDIPTVFFAVDFDIDDTEFNQAEQLIAEVKIKPKKKAIKVEEYDEPDFPEFDENCTVECKPGAHVCGK